MTVLPVRVDRDVRALPAYSRAIVDLGADEDEAAVLARASRRSRIRRISPCALAAPRGRPSGRGEAADVADFEVGRSFSSQHALGSGPRRPMEATPIAVARVRQADR